MPWQVWILISVVLFSLSSIIQRWMLKENNSRPIAYAIVFQLFIGALVSGFALLTNQWQWPNFQPIWLNVVIMVVLYTLANIFIFTALKHIESSKFTILFALRGIVTVFVSSWLLREGLDVGQWLGVALILAAIVLINFQSQQLRLSKFDLFALGAGLCFGMANTNDRILLMQMNVYVFTALGFTLPGLVLAVMYPKELPHTKMYLQSTLLKKMAALCVLYSTSALAFFIALQLTTNSSQVATINLSSVVLVVVFAAVFLKERSSLLKKAVATAMTVLGLYLVS